MEELTDEAGLLASVLAGTLDPERNLVDDCRRLGIAADDFTDLKWRTLYSALLAHAATISSADRISVFSLAQYMKEKTIALPGSDEPVVSVLQTLLDQGTSVHFEHYAANLKQKSLARRFRSLLEEYARRVLSDRSAALVDWHISSFEEQLLKLLPDPVKSESFGAALANQRDALKRLIESGSAAMEGLPTGFRWLDEKLFGLKGGQLIVIAARPSVGKTTLGLNIAQNVAARGVGVLVFSCEMDNASLARRMLGGAAGIDQWRASRDLMTSSEKSSALERLDAALNRLSGYPLYVEDGGTTEVAEMRLHARRQVRQHGIGLIVVDYLQLLSSREASGQGRQLESARISRELKGMARELKVPVIAVSQLSRTPEKSGDREERPKLSDLRDSGAIEQDADIVIFLTRPAMVKALKDDPKEKDRIYVDIAKHRNGELGRIPMRFNAPFCRLEDLSVEEYRLATGKTEASPEPNDFVPMELV